SAASGDTRGQDAPRGPQRLTALSAVQTDLLQPFCIAKLRTQRQRFGTGTEPRGLGLRALRERCPRGSLQCLESPRACLGMLSIHRQSGTKQVCLLLAHRLASEPPPALRPCPQLPLPRLPSPHRSSRSAVSCY